MKEDIKNTALYKRISDLLASKLLNIPEPTELIDPDRKLGIEDVGLDELDNVELVLYLEEEFSTPLTDEDAGKFYTLRDVYKCFVDKGFDPNTCQCERHVT